MRNPNSSKVGIKHHGNNPEINRLRMTIQSALIRLRHIHRIDRRGICRGLPAIAGYQLDISLVHIYPRLLELYSGVISHEKGAKVLVGGINEL